MLFNKEWVDEWVPNNLSVEELSDLITMAGLEVDSVSKVCGEFDGVVTAGVVECRDHPDSDHMRVAMVDDGSGELHQVVCGAPNCRAGIKVCFSRIGAHVGKLHIKKARLRGVDSCGMLCSYRELGMSAESDGIIELPEDAPLGVDVHEYFRLNDSIVDVDLTTNRPDCLGIYGISREVAVLTGREFSPLRVREIPPTIPDILPVRVEAPAACPRYITRVVRGVNQKARSPLWMVERLRRCGIRSVSPIVDVTNYVMLEYSQPLHSFDMAKLHGGIIVRMAKEGEPVTVLSGERLTLSDNTLLITDYNGPVALAGIFGALNSGIDANTVDVVLESAFFAPDFIKGRARQYGLDTDAAHRFERGVDHDGQRRAVERATELLLQIGGGEAGPVNEVTFENHIPRHEPITLRLSHLQRVLGVAVEPGRVEFILRHLGLNPERTDDGFKAVSPSFRFDIAIEEDLIEEVARIYGYNNIPNAVPVSTLDMVHDREERVSDRAIKENLVASGYNEAITYSFTDPALLKVFSDLRPLTLTTPLSPEMSAMRTTLLAGLAAACRYNLHRQQKRVRLFEQGLRYIRDERAENGVLQEAMIAGVATGPVHEESWNASGASLDFFDIKGDVERLLALTGKPAVFRRAGNGALHPGQSAAVFIDGRYAGLVGMLHPAALKQLGFRSPVGVFELRREALAVREVPVCQEISRFPAVRRDLAFVVSREVEVSALCALIRSAGGSLVRQVLVFDVFEDESLGDRRSVALGVIAQDPGRTLEDREVDDLIGRVVRDAHDKFNAVLRT